MTSPLGEAVVPNDPSGAIKPDKKEPLGVLSPREINDAHTKSDVDTSQQAQHHTIGLKRNQVAGGMHNHGGSDSRRVGTGLGLTVTGLLAPATVAQVDAIIDSLITQLQKVIDLKDGRT